jgi:formylmethanofuran dehydrogenase subunit E
MNNIQPFIQKLSQLHQPLCPRQVLGVRMALAGAKALGLDLPRTDKNMLVISETDGCFVDGLIVAAAISPGHRTLRIVDYGKVAATFIDVIKREAVRLAPNLDVRLRALEYVPDEPRHYYAQLRGYQIMPDEVLFSFTPVTLSPSIEQIISRPGLHVNCSVCGEEIMNEREIAVLETIYCRSCFGQSYYCAKEDAYPNSIVETQTNKPA